MRYTPIPTETVSALVSAVVSSVGGFATGAVFSGEGKITNCEDASERPNARAKAYATVFFSTLESTADTFQRHISLKSE